MDFVDWCHRVLGELARTSSQDAASRSIGTTHFALGTAVFGSEFTSPGFSDRTEYQGFYDALEAVGDAGLAERQGMLWQVTTLGDQVLHDPTDLWTDVCSTRLKPEQEQLLRAVNQLSPHVYGDHASLVEVHSGELLATLDWNDSNLLAVLARELHQYRMIHDRSTLGFLRLRSTYFGLVWETRRGYTKQSRFIDTLVRDWETVNVDHKQELHLDTNDEKVELVKDVIALANTKVTAQRWLVIGFDDKTREYHGPPDPTVTRNRIEQIVNMYTRPTVQVRYDIVPYPPGPVGLLEVLRDPADLPYRVARSLRGEKRGMKEGQIFIRRNTQRAEASTEEVVALEEEARWARGIRDA